MIYLQLQRFAETPPHAGAGNGMPSGVAMGWVGKVQEAPECRGPQFPGKTFVHVRKTFNRFADFGM